MREERVWITFFVASAALFVATTGCGGGGTKATSTGTTATTATNATTATTATTATSATTATTSTTATTGTIMPCYATYTPNYANQIQTSSDPNVKGSIYTWPKLPINVYFPHDSNWTPTLQNDAESGFTGWASSLGQPAFYKVVTDAGSAQLTVTFTTASALGQGTLGITNGSVSNKILTSATMQILNGRQDDQITQTCAHEFGHALGIFGHSPFGTDLMYYAQTPASPTLPMVDDTNTLNGDYCGAFFTRAPAAQSRTGTHIVTIRN